MGGGGGHGGYRVTDGDMTWGGEHTLQCTDGVLWDCALNLYNFVNQGHPSKFNKKEKYSSNIKKKMKYNFHVCGYTHSLTH